MRYQLLTTALRWLTAVLILRVLGAILANYPDYFPPDFDSLFLQGRETTFTAGYQLAFYAHILAGPVVLFGGLILLSERARRRWPGGHRWLGRVQVVFVLLIVLPTGAAMSRRAFGGWPAGLSFLTLSVVTAACTIAGVVHARRRNYDRHRRWMLRSYLLICSAVVLRLISGAASLWDVENPERLYVIAAWCSWPLPLTVFEIAWRLPRLGAGRPEPRRAVPGLYGTRTR